MHTMTRIGIAAAAALAIWLAASGSTATTGASEPPGTSPANDRAAQIARGKYLVTIGSCNDCHTPWKSAGPGKPAGPDMTRMLSGHPAGAPDPASELKGGDTAVVGPTFTAWRMPFGVAYTANLTPDKDTGLGNWTEEMFVRALRTGRHMGGNGRVILPPMPWPLIGQMTDEDLKAVFAFLQSIPPVRNDVPPHKVPDAVIEQLTVETFGGHGP